MEFRRVSEAVIRRMPKYYRQLTVLRDQGMERISSGRLAQMMRLNASQVRQDFNCFGGFGQQGYGYDVSFLKNQIANLLGLDREYNVVVIGGGNIGTALANYRGFLNEGFHVLAVFDLVPEAVHVKEGIEVLPVERFPEYAAAHTIDIAMIAVSAESAKEVGQLVIKNGIRAVWNFAPVDLYLGENVAVENINMSESLFMLSYKFKNLKGSGEKE